MKSVCLIVVLISVLSNAFAWPKGNKIYDEVTSRQKPQYNRNVESIANQVAENESNNGKLLTVSSEVKKFAAVNYLINVSRICAVLSDTPGNRRAVRDIAAGVLDTLISGLKNRTELRDVQLELGTVVVENFKDLYLVTVVTPVGNVVKIPTGCIFKTPYSTIWGRISSMKNITYASTQFTNMAAMFLNIAKPTTTPITEKVVGAATFYYGILTVCLTKELTQENFDTKIEEAIQNIQTSATPVLKTVTATITVEIITSLDDGVNTDVQQNENFFISYVFLAT